VKSVLLQTSKRIQHKLSGQHELKQHLQGNVTGTVGFMLPKQFL